MTQAEIIYVRFPVLTAASLMFRIVFWDVLPGDSSLLMEAVRTSETSVDNHFTRQYIPEDNSEHEIIYFAQISNTLQQTEVRFHFTEEEQLTSPVTSYWLQLRGGSYKASHALRPFSDALCVLI
jgi:hypothetical protein